MEKVIAKESGQYFLYEGYYDIVEPIKSKSKKDITKAIEGLMDTYGVEDPMEFDFIILKKENTLEVVSKGISVTIIDE